MRTEKPIKTEAELIDDAEQALELAKAIIYDTMKTHNIYPSVGNFAFIGDTIVEIKRFKASKGVVNESIAQND